MRCFKFIFIVQPPNCGNRKRFRREDQAIDESPATIEVYSGLYVNEAADSGNPEQMDQVAREKVCYDIILCSYYKITSALLLYLKFCIRY